MTDPVCPLALAVLCVLAVLSCATAVQLADPYSHKPETIPFHQYPMIMSHDAATGYISGSSAWVKTQTVGLSGQLNCGARSFDYRPYCMEDSEFTIFAAHGAVTISRSLQDSIAEVKTWCREHPTELVVLYLGAVGGVSNCRNLVNHVLSKMGVPVVVESNSSSIEPWTYSDAYDFAELPDGGGRLLALSYGISENYDETIECYKLLKACYGPGKGKDARLKVFDDYMAKYTVKETSSHRLQMQQAHWQYSRSSVPQGIFLTSSIFEDEERSHLNERVLTKIRNKEYARLNFLELDHVCDQGPNVYKAIQDVYLSGTA